MATDTDRFQSRFKRENRTERVGAARAERRRIYEDGSERTERPTSGVSISVGSSRSSRDRHTDRTDSPATRKAQGESITQRMNMLNLKDDNKDTNDDVDKEPDEKAVKNDDEDDDGPKKSHKKERGGASVNASRKRQARKNLREKRRSTGVVIMPGQPV